MVNDRPDLDLVLHALSDPTRRAIVERLVAGPASVKQLAAPFAMSLPAVMQHIGVLAQAGVVRTEKAGRVRTCRIEPAALREAERWLAAQRTSWERRLDRLAAELGEAGQPQDEETRETPDQEGTGL